MSHINETLARRHVQFLPGQERERIASAQGRAPAPQQRRHLPGARVRGRISAGTELLSWLRESNLRAAEPVLKSTIEGAAADAPRHAAGHGGEAGMIWWLGFAIMVGGS